MCFGLVFPWGYVGSLWLRNKDSFSLVVFRQQHGNSAENNQSCWKLWWVWSEFVQCLFLTWFSRCGKFSTFVAGLKLVGTVFGERLVSLQKREEPQLWALIFQAPVGGRSLCFTNKLTRRCYFCVSNPKGDFKSCEILSCHYNWRKHTVS